MNRCKKTIIIVFFCFLGDIAYSTEKYSKTSQKNFNTFLELSQSSEYKKLLKKNISSFSGLQKELAIFYQADAYFQLKNYKKSQEIYKQLPASLRQVFVSKKSPILYKQNKQILIQKIQVKILEYNL